MDKNKVAWFFYGPPCSSLLFVVTQLGNICGAAIKTTLIN